MRGVLLALLLLAAPVLAKAKKRPPRQRAPVSSAAVRIGSGQVTFATATTVYFDRGTLDGVAVGMPFNVWRGGRVIGRCTIAAASERWATCPAQGFKEGDVLAVPRSADEPPPPALPPVPAPAELATRRQQVEAEGPPRVDFEGGSALTSGTRRAAAALSHQSFIDVGAVQSFHVQRLDVAAFEVPLWRGLRGSLDVSVLEYAARPDDSRSLLTHSPTLLVRRVELAWDEPGSPLVARVGRAWTRHTPGLLMLDGAQAGWRSRDGSIEAGAFGGLLPDPVYLGFAPQRWTAGAFFMAQLSGGSGAAGSLLQLEARAGYAVRAPLAGRLEVGAAVNAWLTRTFDAHLQLQLGMLGAEAPAFVDSAWLDLGWRPTQPLRVWASARYLSRAAAESVELGVRLPGQSAIHADAGVTAELSRWLWLGITGGAARDLSESLSQARLGLELTVPRLFGRDASLGLGYQEELGWIRGRSAWLQTSVRPVDRLRIFARAGWLGTQGDAAQEGIAGHELTLSVSGELNVFRWLWVRATSTTRAQVGAASENLPAPLGQVAMVQVGGQL